MKMKGTNRTNVAAYVAAHRHLRNDLRGAKTLTQMATELGTTKSTVRRWLRRDHWDLWMEHWASVDELWEAAQQDRLQMSAQIRKAQRQAHAQQEGQLMMALHRSLLEMLGGIGITEGWE
jgi:uncharacterized protein YjcR